MDIKELLKIAIDALLANKMRTFLTALGIIIGTASVISMVAIGNGAKASVESRIASLGANTLTISPGSSRTGLVSGGAGSSQTLIIDDYTALKDTLSPTLVSGISPEQSKNEQLIYGENNTNVSVIGVMEDYLAVRNYTIKSGSFFTNLQDDHKLRVIVLGSTTAETLFGTEDPLGKEVQVGHQLFTVIGVLNAKGQTGFQNQDDIALVPLGTEKSLFSGTDALRSIAVQVKDQSQMTNVQAQMSALLIERHNVDPASPDFSISNSQDTIATLSSVTDTFTLLLGGIAGISLFVGGIGIMNTMIISITERTREIGLRKAIGAKNKVILMQFIIESIVLSTLGALFGIVLGVLITIICNVFGIVAAKISLESVILSASISMLIGLVFGIYPARQASLLNPIDALRYE